MPKLALKELHERFGAVLMGGAVRDTLLGKPVKDYDVYINFEYFSELEAYLEELGLEYEEHLYIKGDAAYDHQYLWNVLDIKGDALDWQIMLYDPQKSFRDILDSFDIGLCMVALNGDMLIQTEKFLKDKDSKTLTVYRNGWGETGVEAHINRLLEKYPDYTVVRKDEPEETFNAV